MGQESQGVTQPSDIESILAIHKPKIVLHSETRSRVLVFDSISDTEGEYLSLRVSVLKPLESGFLVCELDFDNQLFVCTLRCIDALRSECGFEFGKIASVPYSAGRGKSRLFLRATRPSGLDGWSVSFGVVDQIAHFCEQFFARCDYKTLHK